jgi:Rad3-related DNA helicase
VVFDEAHEALDIFASLLGTSLTTSRLRALSGVSSSLLGSDFHERCDQLIDVADRLATSLRDPVRHQPVDRD